MESSNCKQVLLKELSDLLGFEDGADDVLEHLVTIESREVCVSTLRFASLVTLTSIALLTLVHVVVFAGSFGLFIPTFGLEQ